MTRVTFGRVSTRLFKIDAPVSETPDAIKAAHDMEVREMEREREREREGGVGRDGTEDEETDLDTLVRRFVSKDFEVVASMRAGFGKRGGQGSEIMRHLRDNFVDPLVYESTDAETELLKID